jgi:hypothetical protein
MPTFPAPPVPSAVAAAPDVELASCAVAYCTTLPNLFAAHSPLMTTVDLGAVELEHPAKTNDTALTAVSIGTWRFRRLRLEQSIGTLLIGSLRG